MHMRDEEAPEEPLSGDDLIAYGESLKKRQAAAVDRALEEMFKLIRSNGKEGYPDIVAQNADNADGSGEFRLMLMHELTLRGIDT